MDSSVKYGLGVTTPNEMARLFALLADGKAVSPKADSAMLDILAHNEDYAERAALRRQASTVPHKTGATDQVRTECALFPLQSRVVGVRADEGERRPALADRQRGAGDDGEHGTRDRGGVASQAGRSPETAVNAREACASGCTLSSRAT